ncbi:MAG: caspase family protein [Pyrinomonadaceae bacterium]
MKSLLLMCAAILVLTGVASAQSEARLKEYFEGQRVILRIDMPATKDGVNIYPERPRPLAYDEYGTRLKQHGTAMRVGDSPLVTKIKLKGKHIEFQLDGGGYGTVGDESPGVSAPVAGKSKREKRLEEEVKQETDPRRRKELKEKLDGLRKDREREDSLNQIIAEQAEEAQRARIEQKALQGGSRFNIHYGVSLTRAVAPTPEAVMQALEKYVDFTELTAGRSSASNGLQQSVAPTATTPAQEPAPSESGSASDLTQATSTVLAPGRYFALVIGNNAYENIRALKTAEDDAKGVENILRGQYGFETRLLLNATRQQIISALNVYRREMGPEANLLIYYAGHGVNDNSIDKAYWLPVDARPDDNANWISADDITSNIKGIPAKHVLIVSDSCYSGTLTRGLELGGAIPEARGRYLRKMLAGKSRTLMASGGNEPVSDVGGGRHSVFASALLRGLTQMEKELFTAAELFRDYVEESVAGRAEQTPEYNPLRNSGHESGDFVFVRQRRAPSATPRPIRSSLLTQPQSTEPPLTLRISPVM